MALPIWWAIFYVLTFANFSVMATSRRLIDDKKQEFLEDLICGLLNQSRRELISYENMSLEFDRS